MCASSASSQQATLPDRRPACPRQTAGRDRGARRRSWPTDHPPPKPTTRSRWQRTPAVVRVPVQAAASATCRASGAQAGPRMDTRPGNAGLRAERSRPALPLRLAARTLALAGRAIRAPATVNSATRFDQPASPERGSPDASIAEISRQDNSGSSATWPSYG